MIFPTLSTKPNMSSRSSHDRALDIPE